jgi:hypothetical protein
MRVYSGFEELAWFTLLGYNEEKLKGVSMTGIPGDIKEIPQRDSRDITPFQYATRVPFSKRH